MKTKSKKLYQKVTNKPKKFGNNNVNSINIIMNPDDDKQKPHLAQPGPGSGASVIQELARITPPSLEDARQIIGRVTRNTEPNAPDIDVSDVIDAGIQTEAQEIVSNANEVQNLARQIAILEEERSAMLEQSEVLFEASRSTNENLQNEYNVLQNRLNEETAEKGIIMEHLENFVRQEQDRIQNMTDADVQTDRGFFNPIQEYTEALGNAYEELTPSTPDPDVNQLTNLASAAARQALGADDNNEMYMTPVARVVNIEDVTPVGSSLMAAAEAIKRDNDSSRARQQLSFRAPRGEGSQVIQDRIDTQNYLDNPAFSQRPSN